LRVGTEGQDITRTRRVEKSIECVSENVDWVRWYAIRIGLTRKIEGSGNTSSSTWDAG
jgi:hypothetical protein